VGFEDINTTCQWHVVRRQLDGGDTLIYQIPPSPPKISGILNGIPDISFYQITICFEPSMIQLLFFDLNSTPANMVANIIYSMLGMLLFH